MRFAAVLLVAFACGVTPADEAVARKGTLDISLPSAIHGTWETTLGSFMVDLRCADDPRNILHGQADSSGHVKIEAPYGMCDLSAYLEEKPLLWGRQVKVSPEKNTVVLSDVDAITAPVIVRQVEPNYPEIARRASIEGYVILQTVVDKKGNVTDVNVLKSTRPMFNAPAIACVKQWKYTPALLNGEPVELYWPIRVDFTLR